MTNGACGSLTARVKYDYQVYFASRQCRVTGPKIVIGDLRVQPIYRQDGRRAYTIVWPDSSVHLIADGFLRTCTTGTARTYAYLLVDHLRWLPFEALSSESVVFRDLRRYMGALGAEFRGPFGRPWRVGKPAYRQSSLEATAAALKGFYLYQASQGVNTDLGRELDRSRLPTTADRRRSLLGHTLREMPANPLRPTTAVRRRHPKMPPEGARELLTGHLASARDRMATTWLADGGFRIGELTGLHLEDLHLRDDAACGQCRAPHVHICHREGLANQSRVKTKLDWYVQDGVVHGGAIRRASPAMVSTYFDYMTTEYPQNAEHHGMLLVNLHGPRAGQPWSAEMARRMLRRAGVRLELGTVKPHQFRHGFATGVLDASGGNTLIARDAGGWASAATVDEIYGHSDIHDPAFVTALNTVWGESR